LLGKCKFLYFPDCKQLVDEKYILGLSYLLHESNMGNPGYWVGGRPKVYLSVRMQSRYVPPCHQRVGIGTEEEVIGMKSVSLGTYNRGIVGCTPTNIPLWEIPI